jgi:hypothetical protein
MKHCSGGGGQLSFSIQVPHALYYTPSALRFTPTAIPLRRLAPSGMPVRIYARLSAHVTMGLRKTRTVLYDSRAQVFAVE